MTCSVLCTIRNPGYWKTWGLSVCLHTMMVGVALLLTQQLPVPQKPERKPVTVSFVASQITQARTPPTQPKLVQPKPISKEISQVRTKTQTKQPVSPKTIVQPSMKPSPQLLPRPTSVTPTSTVRPKTVLQTQPSLQPTVRKSAGSPQAIARPVGKPAPQPLPHSTSITQQHTAAKVHASTSHREPIHVNAMSYKGDPVAPRNRISRGHVANVSRSVVTASRGTPQRQSVNAKPSHAGKITRAPAMEVTKHTQPENSAVQTRARVSYPRQTRRPDTPTISRPVSKGGISPELLAFSRLLREKISRTLKYPRLAKRLGYSGTPYVVLDLSKTGIAQSLKIWRTSGHDILDRAAIDTMEKVLPTVKSPESIKNNQIIIPIAFDLRDN